jgi:hypothetical protein
MPRLAEMNRIHRNGIPGIVAGQDLLQGGGTGDRLSIGLSDHIAGQQSGPGDAGARRHDIDECAFWLMKESVTVAPRIPVSWASAVPRAVKGRQAKRVSRRCFFMGTSPRMQPAQNCTT